MNQRLFLAFQTIHFIFATKSPIQNSCTDFPKLKTIPGFGWDALTNKDRKQLLNLTYNFCKTTDDGKYLIPDETFALQTKTTDVQITGELIEHWSQLIPAEARGFQVSTTIWPDKYKSLYFSFSREYQEMKQLQVKHEAFTTRTQLRQLYYILKIIREVPLLNSVREKLLEVMRIVSRNCTETAQYLLEEFVRDYGTHFSKTVDVGAMLIGDDYLPLGFLTDYQKQDERILSVAKMSLMDFLGRSWQYEFNDSLLEEYDKKRLERKIKLIGELDLEKGLWHENMATIDRSGNLLTELISTFHFPKAPIKLLNTVHQMLGNAIEAYYKRNTHSGCIYNNSTNFDYAANFDDDSCYTHRLYTFGGAYQSCIQQFDKDIKNACFGFVIKNPLTNNIDCPPTFSNVLLHSEVRRYEFHDSGIQYNVYVNLSTHFCITYSDETTANYQFGGFYSHKMNNAFTFGRSCPKRFRKLILLSGKLVLCMSNLIGADSNYSLPFGGLTCCKKGLLCPSGYTPILAFEDKEIGVVQFCSLKKRVNKLGVIPAIIRPPFTNDTDLTFAEEFFNSSEFDDYGMPISSDKGETSESSTGSIVYTAALCGLIFCLLVLGLVLVYRQRGLLLSYLYDRGVEPRAISFERGTTERTTCRTLVDEETKM